MVAITAKYKNQEEPFVCGLFKTMDLFVEYKKNCVSENLDFNIQELSVSSFPIFIIERENNFIFTDKLEYISSYTLDNFTPTNNENDIFFNLYFVESYFDSGKNVKDNMGALNHIHIDNKYFELIKTNVNLLLQEI